MSAIRIAPQITRQTRRSDPLLLAMLAVSAALHGGALYASNQWGDCLCRLGKVVCPKICYQQETRIDLELKPPPPPQPQPRPKPQALAPERPDKPRAAPKRGRVVLPDEALKPPPAVPRETTARLPSLPEEAVAKESETQAPMAATPEIFGRAHELSAGPPGEYGLGGTGKGTGSGGFGAAEEGSGSAGGNAATAPPPPPPPKPEPPPKPKGPSHPPKVLNWTDPPYPEQARQQGVEGTVTLRLTVERDGAAREVRVSRSSGHPALDEAAVAHLRHIRFSPAVKDGVPVATTITFKVKFRLVNS